MADISPFSAYRYNLDRVRLADVVTQPYDKITPAMRERYLQSGPYNLISVEKGKPEPGDTLPDQNNASSRNIYTRAELALEKWIRDGILVRDSAPGIYVYFQEYTAPGTMDRRTRKGFIAAGRVEDYDAHVVFRHEYTLSGPKADRLELLRHTRTHTGQLFMLYTDPEKRVDALLNQVAGAATPAEVRDEYGVVHRLWPVFDPTIIATVKAAMAPQKLVIADGHHRYETALAYRNECRAQNEKKGAASSNPDAPYERAMMTFFNTRGEGLLILPTHRVVANLKEFDPAAFRSKMDAIFDQQDYSFGSDAARGVAYDRFQRDLALKGRQGRAIGMYTGGAFTLLQLRPGADLAALLPDASPAQRQLDVVLLHRILLERGLGITPAAVTAESNITYEREMPVAIAAVDEGSAQVCFLLNPVGVEQTTEMALGGEVMPQKSTDFFPKLLSGLTLYRLS